MPAPPPPQRALQIPAAPSPQWHTDQRPQSGSVVLLAWVIAVLTLLYMAPWAVAVTRGRSNQAAVGLVNLLAGWSVIGWIVALVMAAQSHQVVAPGAAVSAATQISINAPGSAVPPGWYPAPDAQGQQYWDGSMWTSHRAP